jgi:putative ABC transport system permease protein
MLSPRWMKLARDVALTPGRFMLMVLAVAAGVFGLATMLSSYTILNREISRNYLDTHPAAATLRIDRIDAPLLRAIRAFPNIAAAEASATVGGQVTKVGAAVTDTAADAAVTDASAGAPVVEAAAHTPVAEAATDAPVAEAAAHAPVAEAAAHAPPGGAAADGARTPAPSGAKPLRLFVVEQFEQMRINTITAEAGAWPPPPGSVLLERESLTLLHAKIGDRISVRNADGSRHQLLIAGSVHDPAMPVPSMSVFAYATPATVASIGADATLRDLRITIKNSPFEIEAIERTAGALALWLKQQGHAVELIRIPPPGQHPHQVIMTSILAMLLLFSLIALILSAVLTATILDGLLAQQVRQIGVLKTVGATAAQVATLYLTLVLLVGVVASFIGIPTGLAAGRAFAELVLVSLLNFSMHSGAVPHVVYLALVATGVFIPLAIAAIPIARAARISVQAAITDFGASGQAGARAAAGTRWSGLADRIPGIDRSLLMALRNSLRRRGRLLLTLSLMATAGAMFISSLSVRKASEQHMMEAAADRHYDLELAFAHAETSADIVRAVGAVPGVRRVEAWNNVTAAKARDDGLEIERTYPDGAHGTLSVVAAPDATEMIRLRMLGGRWLAPGEVGAVVLNHKATESFPQVKVGDLIGLSIHGHPTRLRVAGIARQFMTGAVAYVTPAGYTALAGASDRSTVFRVAMAAHDGPAVDRVMRQIEAALARGGFTPPFCVTEAMLRKEGDSHFDVMIGALLFISILMAVVGVFGLGSAMSTNVGERTREFGIMRSIGASSAVVLRNVLAEGVWIGLMSWTIAIALAVPLSAAISAFLGQLLFDTPFPLALSGRAGAIWLLVVVAGAVGASLVPAWRASRLTIRETLTCL